ncbi:MAG TPA: rhodanese-like domain-containing protein, partial [Isosphaeraceae bacterium]|nr:rhodanese-like domain-containing protein [Isosphaeraceae bacterium]
MAAELLLSTDWLAEHLGDANVRVIDIRGHVVTSAVAPGVERAAYRGAREEYLAGHIPGAVYIDWTTDITDPDDPVPAQVAPPDRFALAMASRGIGDQTHVVAVDQTGGQFATRLWWALCYYGHDDVSVLDGGWNAWAGQRRPVETGDVSRDRAVFTPRTRPGLRVTAGQLARILDDPDFVGQIVDARDAEQYSGVRRRGPRGGHVPGAINVPRDVFFAPQGGFLPLDEI